MDRAKKVCCGLLSCVCGHLIWISNRHWNFNLRNWLGLNPPLVKLLTRMLGRMGVDLGGK